MAKYKEQIAEVIELIKKVDTLPKVMSPKLQKTAEEIKQKMKKYPPPRPSSTYIRTGALGRSWYRRTTTNKKSVRTAIFSEDVEYAPYVQKGAGDGEPSQAWMHERHWQTHTNVAFPYENIIESMVIDELVKLISS